MHFLELLLIALALGTDAFAVTLANGLAFSGDRLGKRMAMPLTFCATSSLISVICASAVISAGCLTMAL